MRHSPALLAFALALACADKGEEKDTGLPSDGDTTETGDDTGIDTGDPRALASYEQFFAAYCAQLEHSIDQLGAHITLHFTHRLTKRFQAGLGQTGQ